MSPDLAFQTIVATQIAAVLPGIVSGAQPPANGPLPYIQFGQSEVTDDFVLGHSLILEVHTWSAAEGPHEVKQFQGAIRDALHDHNFTQDEWLFTCVREDQARTFLDVDGETWHGVQRFRTLASGS